MSRVYPIFLQMEGRPALIVGGGKVALRKASDLVEAGAEVTILAPKTDPELSEMAQVRVMPGAYSAGVMGQKPRWALVFAATDQPAVNEAVIRDAQAAGILSCRCDETHEGDFVGGAALRRGGVTLAVNTQRASPELARRIRDAAGNVDPVLFQWADLLSQWRPQVIAQVKDVPRRRALLLRMAGPDIETVLRSGGEKPAEALLQAWLAETLQTPESGTPGRISDGS